MSFLNTLIWSRPWTFIIFPLLLEVYQGNTNYCASNAALNLKLSKHYWPDITLGYCRNTYGLASMQHAQTILLNPFIAETCLHVCNILLTSESKQDCSFDSSIASFASERPSHQNVFPFSLNTPLSYTYFQNIKQLWLGWNAESLGFSSGSKLFTFNATFVSISSERVNPQPAK